MALASVKLQADIKAIVDNFVAMRNEALDIYNLYWKGGVNSGISGLSSGDPASNGARLTKAQLSSALTLVDQLGNQFFENNAITTGDYMATCQVTLYGNATPTLISVPVEGFANRVVQFSRDCVAQYNLCRNAENFYGATLYTIIDGLATGSTLVPDSEMTKDEALAAMTLIHMFQLFLENQAVTAGFYKTTLGLWSRF